MGATVVLEDTSLEVEPGAELRVQATVTNTGSVVDAFALEVLALPDGWAHVEPGEVRLLPGRRARVTVVVAPPRAWTTSTGLHVLGVRAASREDRDGSVVEEAVLEVLPFADVSAELVPRSRSTRGLRRRSFVVAVDNRGNAPVTVELDAVDPDQHLVLAVASSTLECVPGSATFGTLLVRARRRYWRGPPLAKGFLALVRVPGRPGTVEELLELPGTLHHGALVPVALPRLATRAALLGAGLLALLVLVLPRLGVTAPDDADEVARASAEEAVSPVEDTALQAAADAAAARQAAEDAAARLQGLPSAPPVPSASPPAASPSPASGPADGQPQPFAARLQVSRSDTGPFLRIAPDRELALQGFVLQPNGDRGEMTLLRDGEALVTARLGDTQVFDLPAPVRFGPASALQFTVLCRNPEGVPCDAAVLLTGVARAVPPSTPAPEPGRVVPGPAAQPQPARTAQPLPSPSPSPSPAPSSG